MYTLPGTYKGYRLTGLYVRTIPQVILVRVESCIYDKYILQLRKAACIYIILTCITSW
jgi:hypothetical protein